MPSRNRPANSGELASRSLNDTAPGSTLRFSDIYATPHTRRPSIARRLDAVQHPKREVSDIVAGPKSNKKKGKKKKEPPLPAAQGDNREASNRVYRSHSMSRRWTYSVMN